MPIEGRLYSAQELQEILGVSKQRVSNLASQQGWQGPVSGLYWADAVEWYLMGRGIDPISLPVYSSDFPEGATIAEREAAAAINPPSRG